MGAFYVNLCARGATADRLAAEARGRGDEGFVGPTVDGWTCLVTESLDRQDGRVIAAYGRALSRDGAAVAVLCHDEDILWVGLYRDSQAVGDFNSFPGYFGSEFDPVTMATLDPAADGDVPILRNPRAVADAFGLDEETMAGLIPASSIDVDVIDLHERWAAALGLPPYSVGMGHRHVQRGESDVDWTPI